jgi:hypothetical protein
MFGCSSEEEASKTIPQITTTTATNITLTTASSGGNVSADGGAPVTSRGVVWNNVTAPTVILATKTTDGSGTGSFIAAIANLTPSTNYYARAYATNSVGTAYGNEITLTTGVVVLPTVTTIVISGITTYSAISGGTIIADGGGIITSRGTVWSTLQNPTISLTTKTSDGNGTGGYTSNLINLIQNTTYYVRAYATNSSGTAYGNQIMFTVTALPFDGLVGYWPFNGNTNDESGNGRNGVKNQVSESADRFSNLNSAYYFDGITSYIELTNTSNVELFGNDFSISVWVNSQSNIGDSGINLISKSINSLIIGIFDNGSSGLPNTNVKYGLGFDTYGKNYGIYPDILPKSGWNHIVCVKTSSGYDYYINNQKYTLPYNQGNVSKSDKNSALFFGKRVGYSGENFKGILDDIAIYNRALNEVEISALYDSTGK